MATTNHERVGKALELLKDGLQPYVERELKAQHAQRWFDELKTSLPPQQLSLAGTEAAPKMDAALVPQGHLGPVAGRLPQDARPGRAQPGERAARPPQQVGAPGAVLQRRRLPRARLDGAAADRRLGAAGRRDRQDEDGAAAPALRRAGAQREAQERGHGHRERGDRQPEAVARGRHAAPRRGQRALPAGRVRGGPVAGPPGRGHRRVPRPGRVLPPHLPHREPEAAAGGRRAAAVRPGRRPGRAAADQLRRRQDALHAGALPPVLRRGARRAVGHRARAPGGGHHEAAQGEARGAGRQQDFAGQPGHQARWHRGAHALGRAGLPARRQEGVRPRQGRRRERHQPRRRAARAVQRVRAVPDPDRRVGGLRAPAPRPERPAGGRLRDAVHLRPGAHRVGQAR